MPAGGGGSISTQSGAASPEAWVGVPTEAAPEETGDAAAGTSDPAGNPGRLQAIDAAREIASAVRTEGVNRVIVNDLPCHRRGMILRGAF
jgi:hypothetical protein